MNTVLLQSRLIFAQKLKHHILKELEKNEAGSLEKPMSTAFLCKHFCLAPKCDKKSAQCRLAASLRGLPGPWAGRRSLEGGRSGADLCSVHSHVP